MSPQALPLPDREAAPMIQHTLHITTVYDDGHETTWTYDQPGTAADAHANLAQRWREAKATFTRDKTGLQLVRVYDHPEIGTYTDTITHIPWTSEDQ